MVGQCLIVATHKLCNDQPRVYQTTFLDKMIQEGPQDSLSGTTPCLSTIITSHTMHVTKFPNPSHSISHTASNHKLDVKAGGNEANKACMREE